MVAASSAHGNPAENTLPPATAATSSGLGWGARELVGGGGFPNRGDLEGTDKHGKNLST